ncbi:MAG: hypothetical protein KIT80_13080 [Chitinophagaceae bacterium]|nr:hypothetical protein [Chitinophagaceae bacterium]MCW5927840.1 hypothetical protein [Chitinophagaceae bacterium]
MGFRLYQLLFITAVLLILLSLFITEDGLNLRLNDTLYVINGVLVLRVIALILLLLWLLYRFTDKFLFSSILSGLHIVLTLAVAATITVFLFYYTGRQSPLPYPNLPAETVIRLQLVFPLFIIFTFLFQVVYIINLILGIIRRFN